VALYSSGGRACCLCSNVSVDLWHCSNALQELLVFFWQSTVSLELHGTGTVALCIVQFILHGVTPVALQHQLNISSAFS
jgi:hypothetical protein